VTRDSFLAVAIGQRSGDLLPNSTGYSVCRQCTINALSPDFHGDDFGTKAAKASLTLADKLRFKL
jgi:hypothetical protein